MLALFVGAVGFEHLVERGLAPEQHMISEYATTGTGGVMEVGFGAWCGSWALLALVFWLQHHRLAATASGTVAAGIALLAAFHTQAVAGELPAGVARTLAGRLHDLGGELVLGGVLVAAVTTMSAKRTRDGRWPRAGIALLGLALTTAGLLLAFGDPAPGLRQRVLLAAAVCYQVSVLHDLRRADPMELTSAAESRK